ncbi:mce related protein [Novipirellula galeiformis]|uniref:Mce related protein n=1 Tax=Novipirellula galeiformis TaxID=2528004 RepID=A0A5C6CTC9_9BACT|nr:MlaD family protein [Novipirellula galeiformis]TWU26797.1 mce related protein [Novipirellula galeiformis]
MDDNKLRFGVGVLVVSAIGIGIILTFLFGAFPNVLSQSYMLTVKFPSAEGVSPNTSVLRDGVRIGRVDKITLLPEGGVLVSLAMDSTQPIDRHYIPTIGNSSLVTGDAAIEFVRADEQELRKVLSDNLDLVNTPFADDDFLDYGKKSKNPYSALFSMEEEMLETMKSIRQAGDSIAVAGTTVNELAIDVQQTVGGADQRMDQLAQEAVNTLEEFQGAIRDVRKIVGSPTIQKGLEDSMSQLPRLLLDAQKTLDSTRETFESFRRVGDRFERVGAAAEETITTAKRSVASFDRTIHNVEKFTEPLGDRGGELVEQVISTLASADLALSEFETLGRSVNNSDGSFKRFLEDDEIYWQIRRTIENVEAASARIRPILDDVRIFSDKIARDPRELGVRGALSKRPSGSGLK